MTALGGGLAPGACGELRVSAGGPPCLAGGMPPAPQAAQLAGQKQSQQQYDPSTGPPVQNAASLHTPPPPLPGRLPPASLPSAPLPPTLQYPPPPPMGEPPTPLHVATKAQPPSTPVPAPPASQLPGPPQGTQPGLLSPGPGKAQMQAPPPLSQPQVPARALRVAGARQVWRAAASSETGVLGK